MMNLNGLRLRLESALKPIHNLGPALLISAGYDGDREAAYLKLYEPNEGKIYLWYDNTGHRPYCYSKQSPEELSFLKERTDVIDLVEEEKLDLINDRWIKVTKIIARDPLAIGGSPKKSIRNQITAWEADIKYYECYIYDRRILPGTFYRVENSELVPVEYELPKASKEILEEVAEEGEFRDRMLAWAKLLQQPMVRLKRVALDIEVRTAKEDRMPDAGEAREEVIAVALVGSDGRREVYLLKREGMDWEGGGLEGVEVKAFDNEREMLYSIFEALLDYPCVVTFNGDDFDLPYLYHRALRLGFEKEEIPISLGREQAYLKHGIHIDLYKVFTNRSVQVYAFGNKYSEYTLNGIGEAILGKGKVKLESEINKLGYAKLAEYCFRDAELTYELTSFDDDLLIKVLVIISRVAKMPLEDVARVGVSNWIRSMLFYEHRLMNALVPRREELKIKGGASSRAVIKGKKYRGGIVVEPVPGVHFNVPVLDFASLYPSIIKVYNLSYETVNCPHEECKSNLIPETKHWICKKRKGLTSLTIGSLRDLRVKYYKKVAKGEGLSKDERSLYEVISQSLKVILNASYGVMGAETFPLYCLPVADATAALGRYVIKSTIKKCEELGIKVIYSDTDSVFLENPREEQIREISEWAEREMGIELDLDKVYRYVAFSQRKKNYLGVLEDGSVDIKGLTGKKSHVPPFIKREFLKVIEALSKVKTEEDFSKVREEIRSIVKESYLKLKRREVSIEDLAFSVMLSMPPNKYKVKPQHVKAAEILMRKGREIKAGDIIRFVKTNTPPGVKPVELAKIDEIDVDKYIDYLRSTFEQIMDALGYSFDEILGVTRLEEYFWGFQE